MQNNGLMKSVMTIGAVGTVAGLAFVAMSPRQQKKIEKSLKKTTDQLSDIVDTIQNKTF